MRIVYAPRALRDIDEILSYIQKHNPQGARSASLAIERTIEFCAHHPGTGSKTDEPGVYRRPLAKYRYTIFYRALPHDGGIEVACVTHGARVRSLGTMPEE